MMPGIKTVGDNVIPERVQERYDSACALCAERQKKIFGKYQKCEYLKKKTYCPEIIVAEQRRLSKEVLSEHMETYIDYFNSPGSRKNGGYKYLKDNIDKFSQEELLAIISAFDYSIYPGLKRYLNCEQIDEVYEGLDNLIRNEFFRGNSGETPR